MSVGRLVDEAVNASIVLVGRALVAVGYWRSERRRDAMAGRAQRFLDAERLAEDEAEIDVWEPQDDFWRYVQQQADANAAEECWACGCRADRHFRNDRSERPCADCGCLGFLIQRPVHPADAKHHGGHRLNLDGTVTPLTLSAQHLSAGGAVGPEAVSGQPPASGQPTAIHAMELVDHHRLTYCGPITKTGGLSRAECACGLAFEAAGARAFWAKHVADLILALVAADVRVGDALKGTGR